MTIVSLILTPVDRLYTTARYYQLISDDNLQKCYSLDVTLSSKGACNDREPCRNS